MMFTPSPANASSAGIAADDGRASNDADRAVPVLSASTGMAAALASSWVVRVEGSLVAMRDNWLMMPGLEIGLTVGRHLNRSWSLELTGSAREVDTESPRSWSGLAAARWVAVESATARHGLTVAGGPFVEVNHDVHGTLAFAHAELAYVYRAPFGLTVLAGLGSNFALASSSYVAPPRAECDSRPGAIAPCLNFGPDAQEIDAGDSLGHMRLALGWEF